MAKKKPLLHFCSKTTVTEGLHRLTDVTEKLLRLAGMRGDQHGRNFVQTDRTTVQNDSCDKKQKNNT